MSTAVEGRLIDALRYASFQIRIERVNPKELLRGYYWGTGFFVSHRHALTAYHNLPLAVIQRRENLIEAFLGNAGEPNLSFRVLWQAASEMGDYATLELLSGQARRIQPAKLARLNTELDETWRREFWRGRRVALFGYPISGSTTELSRECVVTGRIEVNQPIVVQYEADPVTGQRTTIERIRFVADPPVNHPLNGVSGGPVADLETGWVVGVEGSVWEFTDASGRKVPELTPQIGNLTRTPVPLQLVCFTDMKAIQPTWLNLDEPVMSEVHVLSFETYLGEEYPIEVRRRAAREIYMKALSASQRGVSPCIPQGVDLTVIFERSSSDYDPDVRHWLNLALGRLGTREARERLRINRNDPNPHAASGAQDEPM